VGLIKRMSQDRRDILKLVAVPLVVGAAAALAGPAHAQALSRTTLSIQGNKFLINGAPTFSDRSYLGKSIEGLLFNSRMANGVVDDQNPSTRGTWAYADGPWDPERNTNELIAALPAYKARGLNAIGVNLQGGSPQGYSWNQPWHLSGFSSEGVLRPDYKTRTARLIEAADALGMVVNLGLFYVSAKPALDGEVAVIRAVDEATAFLCEGGYRNVLVEITNELDLPSWRLDLVRPARCHELIQRVQRNSMGRIANPAGRLLVSSSFTRTMPSDEYFAAADYVLLHGNGITPPDRLREHIRSRKANPAYRGQPLLINEDDHFDFDQPHNNMVASIGEFCGWGYFDYRMSREGYINGFQSLPVDWTINSPRKRGFFDLLAQVTGSSPG